MNKLFVTCGALAAMMFSATAFATEASKKGSGPAINFGGSLSVTPAPGIPEKGEPKKREVPPTPPKESAKCRALAFTIPQYDLVLKDKNEPGANIKVTVQRNAKSAAAVRMADDLKDCNPNHVVTDVSPSDRRGFADIKIGYQQQGGSTVWIPADEEFRLAYVNPEFNIVLLEVLVRPSDNRVVLK